MTSLASELKNDRIVERVTSSKNFVREESMCLVLSVERDSALVPFFWHHGPLWGDLPPMPHTGLLHKSTKNKNWEYPPVWVRGKFQNGSSSEHLRPLLDLVTSRIKHAYLDQNVILLGSSKNFRRPPPTLSTSRGTQGRKLTKFLYFMVDRKKCLS